MATTYRHEWATDDEGWKTCTYCGRTTRDPSLFDKVECVTRVEAPTSGRNYLEPKEYKFTRAVSDETLAGNAAPSVLVDEVRKMLYDQLKDSMRENDALMLNDPEFKQTPMTSVAGYTVFSAKALGISAEKIRISRTVSASAYANAQMSALKSFGITADEVLLHEDVIAEVRKRALHECYDITYSSLPFGDSDIVVTATALTIPKVVAKAYKVSAP